MKIKLLKRLRKEAKYSVYIRLYMGDKTDREAKYPLIIVYCNRDRYSFENLEEAEIELFKSRREWILEQIYNMRRNELNKQLRKL